MGVWRVLGRCQVSRLSVGKCPNGVLVCVDVSEEPIRTGQAMLGQVSLGQVRLGQV